MLMQIATDHDANDAVRAQRAQPVSRAPGRSVRIRRSMRCSSGPGYADQRTGSEIYGEEPSGQDPLNYPIRVNNQIASLAGVVSSTELVRRSKATSSSTLTRELEVYLVDLRQTWKDMLPPIDDILKKHGHPAVEVKPSEVKSAGPRAEEEAEGRQVLPLVN
jgi:hypothetical protein